MIIFLLAFVALGAFAFYLSRTIEHGEAQFGPDGRMISPKEPGPTEPVRPARRIVETDTAGEQS
jgi:hypothetical protein